MSNIASWLNSAFYGLDYGLASAANYLNSVAGGFFRPLSQIIDFIGDNGLIFIVIAVIFLLFKKTRKTGLSLAVGLIYTGIVALLVIKNVVGRPRPFLDTSSAFYQFWYEAGENYQSAPSFPSGHATSAMVFATVMFMSYNKKISWLWFLIPLLFGFTRIYLVVHYASDVLGGFILGGLLGVGAYYTMFGLYHLPKFCKFMDVDLILTKDTAKKEISKQN